MKCPRLLFFTMLIFLLALSNFAGCSNPGIGETSQEIVCPFTTLTWENTYDDMIALEENDYKSYDSVYNGTTYSYPKRYLDRDGIIKYMYNGDGDLMCTAWVYSGKIDENLEELYSTIHTELTATYGKSGYDTENSTNYGDVWYLDDGHIILSVMTTSQQNALQYSYLSPEASE